jgi:DNA-binding XRE family transcriptional regulator
MMLAMEEKPTQFEEGSFVENLRIALQDYRGATGLQQDDIAKICKTSRQAINAFENGKNVPRGPVLNKLVELLFGDRASVAADLRNLAVWIQTPNTPPNALHRRGVEVGEALRRFLNTLGSGNEDDVE